MNQIFSGIRSTCGHVSRQTPNPEIKTEHADKQRIDAPIGCWEPFQVSSTWKILFQDILLVSCHRSYALIRRCSIFYILSPLKCTMPVNEIIYRVFICCIVYKWLPLRFIPMILNMICCSLNLIFNCMQFFKQGCWCQKPEDLISSHPSKNIYHYDITNYML